MTETAQEAGSPPEVTEQPTETQVPETAAPDQSDKPDPNVTANGEKLDRQTRNWRALERDRDHWREMAMRQAPPQAPPPAPTREAEPVKTLADFEYDEAKFQAYIFDQATKRSVEAARRELEESQQRETTQRRISAFRQREAEFAKTVEDYNEVAHGDHVRITHEMAEAIRESDDGPALAYHLGKNLDVAAKIAQLPPIAAARELGRIEARLAFEREKAKEASKVSKAPPPPPRVDAVEPAMNVRADEPASDQLSADEWRKKREKQLARRKS